MKLTIFGATGGTGQQLIEQALTAGHRVVALIRNPAKLTTQQTTRPISASSWPLA